MRHAYLEKLGCEHIYEADIDANDPDEGRKTLWAAQRQKYGFDDRETWNLNTCFYAWLYERLQMYLDRASTVINLEYHTFEYDGKTYTQKEMIEQICEIIEYYFSDKYNDWDKNDEEYVSNIEKMWAVVMPAMWW